MERQLVLPYPRKLFAMLYQPDECVLCPGKAFLLLHPFAEEKKSAQRILVAVAKSICKAGFPVLLFDLSGCADSFSQGTDDNITLNLWIEDITAARSYLKQESNAPDICIIGVRLGAYLALLHQKQMKLHDELILIAPVLDPIQHLKHLLRGKQIKELCTGGRVLSSGIDLSGRSFAGNQVDFDGYMICADFVNSLHDAACTYRSEDLIDDSHDITAIIISETERKTINPFASFSSVTTLALQMPLFWNRSADVNPAPLTDMISRLVRHE